MGVFFVQKRVFHVKHSQLNLVYLLYVLPEVCQNFNQSFQLVSVIK